MRRGVALIVVMAALLAAAPPAGAKGPWRITVRGPGITGEVDLMEGRWPVVWIGYPDTIVAEPGPERPGASPPYVVTWYSAAGWDTPVVDRVAVHFDTSAVEVLDSSVEFFGGSWDGGWFVANERGIRELQRAIELVIADGTTGAAGYEFVSDGTTASWEPVPGRSWVTVVLTGLLRFMPW